VTCAPRAAICKRSGELFLPFFGPPAARLKQSARADAKIFEKISDPTQQRPHNRRFKGFNSHVKAPEGHEKRFEGHVKAFAGHKNRFEGHCNAFEGHEELFEGYVESAEGHGKIVECHEKLFEGHVGAFDRHLKRLACNERKGVTDERRAGRNGDIILDPAFAPFANASQALRNGRDGGQASS
jgi:hypothetical protein